MTPQPSSALTPSQAQAVDALAEGATVTGAATAAGIHRSTVYQWLRTHQDFEHAVQQARSAYRTALNGPLSELTRTAFATLRALLENPQTPPAIRAKVALAILDRSRVSAFDGELPQPDTSDTSDTEVSDLPEALPRESAKTNPILASPAPKTPHPGRNQPCPCGSGKKFKRCCLGKPAGPAPA
jgi:transposase-like protein